jgi:hypothetical protein
MEVSMRNTIKLFGIITLVVVIGLSAAACMGGPAPKSAPEAVSITITGIPGSEYAGWKLLVMWDDAWTMPLSVTNSTTSLTFSMLNMSNDKPYNKSGNYMVILSFQKEGEKDADFVKLAHPVNRGDNTIPFSSFSGL